MGDRTHAVGLNALLKQAEAKRKRKVAEKRAATAQSAVLVEGQNNANGRIRLVPFTRRYAPKKLEDVQYQDEVVRSLMRYLQNVPESAYSMPNMIFYGPPGVGKTTCVELLERRLYENKKVRAACVLKLNASNERGIDAVRNCIKKFASIEPPPSAPFKLIVLDECDNMTPHAQFALRRVMEPNVSHAACNKPRFILMCNYLTRVIEPIVSRCHRVRFKPIDALSMCSYLSMVARRERWSASADVISEIVRISVGDMRCALTLMQSLVKLWGDNVCVEHVADVAGEVPNHKVAALLDLCIRSDSTLAKVIAKCHHMTMREAYSGESILKCLVELARSDERMSERAAAQACIDAARAEFALKRLADDYLQLLNVVTKLRANVRRWPCDEKRSDQTRPPEFKIVFKSPTLAN